MIIDPGAEAKVILGSVDELGLTISLIVATHSHPDHVGVLQSVKKATRAEFAIHEAEAQSKGLERFAQVFGEVIGTSFEPLPNPDRLLRGGDNIEVGDLRFLILHTPGHSPGGICLLGHGAVFCGDTLFNYSIGRTDFPGCSYTQLMNNIHTKLMILPDETKVFPGHGPETTIGFERKWNPFLRD
jgi:glyoxylase-like metal-dependent hydrolase (beta-lactamase superfamily II)